MGNNIAARAVTAGELISLRSPGQSSKRFIAIQTPNVIYSARINQTFSSLDSAAELIYDGGSGTLADVLEGMTLYIGTSSGAKDKGIVRIRKVPTATVFYIAETSDVQFAENDYLTVVNLMPPYPRDIRIPGGIPHVDFDLLFGTVRTNLPMPILGPIASVIELEIDASGNYVPYVFTPPLPTNSFSPYGATISSYLFACPDAASTADLTTTTPTFTIDAPGIYMWSCQVTDSNGNSQTGYRWIFADPASPIFNADDPEGDFSSGQFSFNVEAYENTTIGEVAERAMVVMYEKSYYDQTEETLGPIAGYENIKCVGWIEDESIDRDPETGVVRFTVQGPAFWLQQIRAFPFGVADTSSAPTTWTEVEGLTVDKALARLLTWYSTASKIMDCNLTDNTNRVQSVIAAGTNLWEQINSIANTYLFANAICNQYGQMYIEIDSQYLPSATRDALPVVMDIQYSDLVRGSLNFERNTISKKSQIELGGLGPYDGTIANPYFSRAPGTAPKTYGGMEVPNAYIFDDQADCNFKAGCMLAVANNDYLSISFTLAHNNPFISIAPLQYITFTVAAGDTPRGIALTAARLIPRSVSQKRNKESGEVQTVVSCEIDTEYNGVIDGITYYPPQPPQDNLMPGFGDIGFDDFPPLDVAFPPLVPPPLDLGDGSDVDNGPYTIYWNKGSLNGADAAAEDRTAEAYFPCIIRPDSFANQSSLITRFSVYDPATWGDVTLTAIRNGADVLSIPYTGGVISGVSAVEIDGFRLVLDYGIFGDGFHPLQENSLFCHQGSYVSETGSIATGGSKPLGGLTPGNWYILRAIGAALADNLYTIDGIGPIGHVLQAGSSGYIDVTYNGINYANGNRPEGSFGFVVQASIRTYGLLLYAAKSSYTIAMAETTGFGGMRLAAYDATIYYPNVIFLAEGTLFNVSPL